MYFYQPALITLAAFLTAGGELYSIFPKRRRYFATLFLLTLVMSAIGKVEGEEITIFPAALVLLVGSFLTLRRHWERVLLSGLFGGVAAWKLADLFPLLFEPALLSGLALGLFVLLYCKTAEECFCACALGGIAYELSFCLQEYFLFSYCRLRLGSFNGLSISTVGLCVAIMNCLFSGYLVRKKQEKQALFEMA